MTSVKRISLVAGARPNFMKIAPIVRALEAHRDVFSWDIVHTGQHYDREMSDVFFEELGIPKPDYHLDAGGGSHAAQTAKIMVGYETVCMESKPDIVMVVGDVNSTLACSIVAKKLNTRVAHVEAGLRSGDRRMPEEINRLVTDSITDFFFVTEESGVRNLLQEGHSRDVVHFVGHVMIDNLYFQLEKLKAFEQHDSISARLRTEFQKFGVLTLHRPSNVDNPEILRGIVSALGEISKQLPLIFPVHPRTANNLQRFGISLPATVRQIGPLPFMEFLNLWSHASIVMTDSGGLQEESSALGVPCLTLRENTERPVTIDQGSNVIVGCDPNRIIESFNDVAGSGYARSERRPELWDGQAAQRICEILRREV